MGQMKSINSVWCKSSAFTRETKERQCIRAMKNTECDRLGFSASSGTYQTIITRGTSSEFPRLNVLICKMGIWFSTSWFHYGNLKHVVWYVVYRKNWLDLVLLPEVFPYIPKSFPSLPTPLLPLSYFLIVLTPSICLFSYFFILPSFSLSYFSSPGRSHM